MNQASLERTFEQADFDRFARLSGDDNPIHTDPDFSSRTRFGRTVAHGLLLCSVLRALMDQLQPGSRLLNQNVMFPAPTFAGEPMHFVVTLNGSTRNKTQIHVDFELKVNRIEDGVVTCQGSARVMI